MTEAELSILSQTFSTILPPSSPYHPFSISTELLCLRATLLVVGLLAASEIFITPVAATLTLYMAHEAPWNRRLLLGYRSTENFSLLYSISCVRGGDRI